MKKAFLAITSLCMLFACSNEPVQETENNLPTTYTHDPDIPYESPFTNGLCCSLINYHFLNESDLDLEFIPYVGLARFDDANDYAHFGWGLTPTSNYPNVFFPTGMEYLNLIECFPIFTGAFSVDTYDNMGQLPTHPIPSTPPIPAIFNIVNKPWGTITIEDRLLYEYGKFYSFEATVTDPTTGNQILIDEPLRFSFLPKGETIPSGAWLPLPATGPETEDLWYHYESLEICIGNDATNYPGGGVGWNDKPSIVEFPYNGKEYRLEAYTTLTDVVVALSIL